MRLYIASKYREKTSVTSTITDFAFGGLGNFDVTFSCNASSNNITAPTSIEVQDENGTWQHTLLPAVDDGSGQGIVIVLNGVFGSGGPFNYRVLSSPAGISLQFPLSLPQVGMTD